MTDDFNDQLFALEFGVHKSLRYHAKRRRFFDAAHRWSLAVTAITGSATFVAVFGDVPHVAKWSAAVLAVMTGLDVAFGFAEQARKHDELYRRFSDLAVKMARKTTPELDDVARWKSERLLIEKDEPTALRILDIHCHNEEVMARDLDENDIHVLYLYQRLAMHFVSLPPSRLKRSTKIKPTPP